MGGRMWLLLLCCCFRSLGFGIEQFSVLKGRIEGKNEKTEMQLMTVVNGVPIKYAGTTFAANGSFAFMFEPGKDDFYYLYDGVKFFRIYVKAGQQTELLYSDGHWKILNADAENRLLQQWNTMEEILQPRGKGEDYAVFFPRFDSVRQEIETRLAHEKNADEVFLDRMKKYVSLDLLNDFISYVAENQQSYESEEQQSTYYRQIIRRFPVRDECLLEQPYGMELLQKYFSYKHSFVVRKEKYSLDQKLDEITSPLLGAEFILAETDVSSFEAFCVFERKYFSYLQNEDQRYRLTHCPQRPHSVLKKGERASNFLYPDTTGKYWSVSDFQGKYKFIDIWATWCAPCKKEIPYLKELEKEFADKPLEFISISIDKNKKKWKDFICEQALGGIQLWAGDWTNLPEELLVGSIPRFILLDKNGNWIDTDAARPSDPELKKLLKNLLKK